MDDRPKVLVVEDDEMFAALLAETLGEYYDVVVAHNGLQGIAACLEGGVAAVVTDIVMPDFNGLQMVTELSKSRRLAAIPVIVMSSEDYSAELAPFPQVRELLEKSKSAALVVDAVHRALQGG